MHLRRTSAIAAGALLLAAPVLSSCGFEYATDRVNTIANGVNDRDGEVDVLGAVIISGTPNLGVVTGTLVNNSTEDYATLTGVSGSPEAGNLAEVDTLTPVALKPYAHRNLNDEAIPVTGTFLPGDFVDVTFTFSNGQTSTLQVQVVRPCNYYEDLVELPPATEAPPLTADQPADAASQYECGIAEPEPHAEGEE